VLADGPGNLNERRELVATGFGAPAVEQLDGFFRGQIAGEDRPEGLLGCTRATGHRRDQPGHDPVPHPRPPDLVGQVRPGRQRVRWPQEGQRQHWTRQPVPRQRAREAAISASRTDTFLGER